MYSVKYLSRKRDVSTPLVKSFIITFLLYEVHAQSIISHGGWMTLLHSHLTRKKDVTSNLHTIIF